MWKNLQRNLYDLFFPPDCLICGATDGLLCGDCRSLMEVSGFHARSRLKHLVDVYSAVRYKNRFAKKMIRAFKYEPFSRQLKTALASLVIDHFLMLDKPFDFSGRILVPVPLAAGRLRWRGYNQAQELAEELAKSWRLELAACLRRTKETKIQTTLSAAQRKTNIKGSISCFGPTLIRGKQILLIDDVITTGTTMEECARVLLKGGAASVTGISVAHAEIDD